MNSYVEKYWENLLERENQLLEQAAQEDWNDSRILEEFEKLNEEYADLYLIHQEIERRKTRYEILS